MSKRCFVIMPIKKLGTSEYEHFKSIYEVFYRAPLMELGYEVLRGDEDEPGRITRLIVERIANFELVLADLTGHNANVFYELGVRHTLKRSGTILTLDEMRNEVPPFDLSTYRLIKFRGEVQGLSGFKRELADLVSKFEGQTQDSRSSTNPVHDFLPSLPIDLVSYSPADREAKLLEENKSIRDMLAKYERLHGELHQAELRDVSSVFDQLQADIEKGLVGQLLVDEALEFARSQDLAGFVRACRRLNDAQRMPPTSKQMLELISASQHLGVKGLDGALVELASRFHPEDESIVSARLMYMCTSRDPMQRVEARRELMLLTQLECVDGRWTFSTTETPTAHKQAQIIMLLDSLRKDRELESALILAKALADRVRSAFTIRNYARALEDLNRITEALDAYRDAVLVDQKDDVAAMWLGGTLSNLNRRVDAVECFALAAVRDPTDAKNFARCASVLSWIIVDGDLQTVHPRDLPNDISVHDIADLVKCAFSCDNRNNAVDDLYSAVQRLHQVGVLVENQEIMSVQARRQIANSIYDRFATELTRPRLQS